MKAILIRFVALLLASSLVIDPATASVFTGVQPVYSSTTSRQRLTQTRFEQEALTQSVAFVLLPFKSMRIRRAATETALGVTGAEALPALASRLPRDKDPFEYYRNPSLLYARDRSQIYIGDDPLNPKARVAWRVVDIDATNQMLNEIEVLQRIKQFPELIATGYFPVLLGSGELADGRMYMVVDYFESGTLYEEIYRMDELSGRQLIRYSLEIVSEIARAFLLLHRVGIRFVDLKPGNILIRKRGTQFKIRLIDFESAYYEDRNWSIPYAAIYTPGYTAPEIYQRHSMPDPRSDVYSLGAILYSMLNEGRLVIDAAPTWIFRWRNKDVRTMIRKAVSFDPQDRQGSVEEFVSQLDTARHLRFSHRLSQAA